MNVIEKEYMDIYELCKCAINVFEKAACDDKLDEEQEKDVGIIVPHNVVSDFLHSLMSLGYNLQCIQYEFEDDYDDEYLITISTLGGIWCEPVLRKNGYLQSEAFVTYVLDTCNSAILSQICSDIIVEAHIISSDDECDASCHKCDKYESILFTYSAIL